MDFFKINFSCSLLIPWTNISGNYCPPSLKESDAFFSTCFRYMTAFASEPDDPRKALRHCKEYAVTLAKSSAAAEGRCSGLQPHRNFEVLFVAISTCLWKMAADGWNIDNVYRNGQKMSS